MTKEEFWIKIGINAFFLVIIILYLIISRLFRKESHFPTLRRELNLIVSNKIKIEDVQAKGWTTGLNAIANFSSICVAVVFLVIALIIDKEIDTYTLIYFKIVLFILAISALNFIFSLFYFYNAIARLQSDKFCIIQRERGTYFNTLAMLGLIVGIMFCIMLIDTVLGSICNFYAVLGMIMIYEIRLPKENN